MSDAKISVTFEQDHDRLDALFHSFQEQKRKEFAKAKEAFVEFKIGLQRHIVWEEDVLFPKWEENSGMAEGGPTQVMRMEHVQMRALMDDAAEALKAGDADGYLGHAETLLIMMQQHNMKEENVLYPMCDQHLAGETPELLARLETELAEA